MSEANVEPQVEGGAVAATTPMAAAAAPSPAVQPVTGGSDDAVSARAQARIDGLLREKRELAERMRDLEARMKEAEPRVAAADVAEQAAEAARADLRAREAAWALERAIMRAGILDDEGVEAARWAYGRLPERGRPEVGAWLENHEALPKAVRAYLPTVPAAVVAPPVAAVTTGPDSVVPRGAPSSNGAPAAPPAVTPLPNPNLGAAAPAPVAPHFTADAIQRMTPEEFRRNQAAILSSLGRATG